jgi:hypothetical protein
LFLIKINYAFSKKAKICYSLFFLKGENMSTVSANAAKWVDYWSKPPSASVPQFPSMFSATTYNQFPNKLRHVYWKICHFVDNHAFFDEAKDSALEFVRQLYIGKNLWLDKVCSDDREQCGLRDYLTQELERRFNLIQIHMRKQRTHEIAAACKSIISLLSSQFQLPPRKGGENIRYWTNLVAVKSMEQSEWTKEQQAAVTDMTRAIVERDQKTLTDLVKRDLVPFPGEAVSDCLMAYADWRTAFHEKKQMRLIHIATEMCNIPAVELLLQAGCFVDDFTLKSVGFRPSYGNSRFELVTFDQFTDMPRDNSKITSAAVEKTIIPQDQVTDAAIVETFELVAPYAFPLNIFDTVRSLHRRQLGPQFLRPLVKAGFVFKAVSQEDLKTSNETFPKELVYYGQDRTENDADPDVVVRAMGIRNRVLGSHLFVITPDLRQPLDAFLRTGFRTPPISAEATAAYPAGAAILVAANPANLVMDYLPQALDQLAPQDRLDLYDACTLEETSRNWKPVGESTK